MFQRFYRNKLNSLRISFIGLYGTLPLSMSLFSSIYKMKWHFQPLWNPAAWHVWHALTRSWSLLWTLSFTQSRGENEGDKTLLVFKEEKLWKKKKNFSNHFISFFLLPLILNKIFHLSTFEMSFWHWSIYGKYHLLFLNFHDFYWSQIHIYIWRKLAHLPGLELTIYPMMTLNFFMCPAPKFWD